MKVRVLASLATAVLLLVGCTSADEQALLVARPTSRADLVQLPGLIREPMPVKVTLPDGTVAMLEGEVTRPDRPGKFPLVLINHGTSSEWSDRKNEIATEFTALAVSFAERGWAAVTVVRPGFGTSGGPFMEDVGSCENRDFIAAGKRMGGEVLAILHAVQRKPWIDEARTLLVGHSGGGLASLAAAATNPKSLLGVVNFAGGAGAPISNPFFCQPDRLVQAMSLFGKTVRVPSLWIYAANDKKFDPVLAGQMYTAFKAGGADTTFISAPAYGDDGHDFINATTQWQPAVDRFLFAQKLPAEASRSKIEALEMPPVLTDTTFFDKYVAMDFYEKALAVGDHGGAGYADGYPTLAAAKLVALQACQRRDTGCHIYAIGNRLAP